MSYYSRSHPYMGYYDDCEDYGYYPFGGPGYGPPRPYRGGYGGYGRGRGRAWGGGWGGPPAPPGPPANSSRTYKTITIAGGAPSASTKKTAVGTAGKSEPGAAAAEPTATDAKPSCGLTTPTTTATTASTAATATTETATAATDASVADKGAKPKLKSDSTQMLTEENPIPAEIAEKFFPDRCELCSAVFPISKDIFIPEKGGLKYMNSTLQSAMHFRGKSHKRQLRSAFNKFCKKNKVNHAKVPQAARELMTEIPTLPPKETNGGDAAAEKLDMICKICDMSFTSIQHASQHYAGRNHQRRLQGKQPLRDGYYNPRTGRWQRQPIDEEERRDWNFSRTDKYLSTKGVGAAIDQNKFNLKV